MWKVPARLDKLDIKHFIRVRPLKFFDFVIYQNTVSKRKKKLVFKIELVNIQAAAYNGAHTVYTLD